MDQSKYGVAFNAVNDSALQLTIDVAKDGAVLANGPIDKSTVKIPEEITKMTNGDIVEVQPNIPTPEKPTEPQEDKPAKPKREFFLITIVKDSWIWLVLLAACAIVYKVMENKKKEKKEKYIEADRNDSGRFE